MCVCEGGLGVLTRIMSCSLQKCPAISIISVRVHLHISYRSKALLSVNVHCMHTCCIKIWLCVTDVRLLFKSQTSYIHLLTLFRNHFH